MHGRIFWLLTLSFGLASFSAAAIRVHFIPFLIESGVDPSTAAFATGASALCKWPGSSFSRHWIDAGQDVLIIGVFLLQSLAMMILLIGQAPVMIGLFIIVFGAAQGAITLARPSILAGLYGSSHYGRISSVLAVLLTLTSTAAPLAQV